MTGLESFFLSMIVSIIIGELTPKPDLPQAKRYGLNEFSIPTATEDRAHTVGFGTFKAAGNVIWFGDYNAVPVQEKVPVSLFQKKTITKGYKYCMGLWMSLCGVPCDAVQEIRLGDYVVWSGDQQLSKTGVTVVDVNKTWTQSEGQEVSDGMVGRFLFYNHRVREGEDFQPLPNPYMEAMLGVGNVPAYPNTLHVVWLGPKSVGDAIVSGMVNDAFQNFLLGLFGHATASLMGFVGSTPSVQALNFVLKRQPDLLDVYSQTMGKESPDQSEDSYRDYLNAQYSALADVNGDANPALVQLEVLTSRVPGLGPRLTAWSVDMVSFIDAARRYKAEGHGVSFAWEVTRPVAALVGDIGMQTNSVVEVDTRGGRLKTKLIRSDDSPVAAFDETNLISITSFTRLAVEQAPNRIEVPFLDRANNWTDRVAFAKNTAAIKQAGTVIDQRAEFIGVSRESLAQYLATREMAKQSAPLAKASFTAWLPVGQVLKPGDLVTFRHPKLEQTLRMRVASARFGSYNAMLRVDVEALEDVFRPGYNFDTGSSPIDSSGSFPMPSPLTEPVLMLAPYALTGDDADHGLYIGNDPGTGVNTYRLAVVPGPAWSDVGDRIFEDTEQEPAIKAALATVISSSEAQPLMVLTLSNEAVQQWRRSTRGELFVIAGNEWFHCEGWTLEGNTLTAASVARAIFDCVPERHEEGASVRVLLGYVVTTGRLRTQAASGVPATDGAASMTVRAESRGPQGIFEVPLTAMSQASLVAAVGAARAPAPLLPGMVKLADVLGGLDVTDGIPTISAAPSMTLSWGNRNRLARLVGSWFSPAGSSEPDAYTAVRLEYQNLDGGWTDKGWSYPSLGASSCSLDTHDLPSKALVRVTVEARKNYGSGDGRTVSSKALQLAWQLA